MTSHNLGIADRVETRIGRSSRSKSISVRFTAAEEKALIDVANDHKKAPREWAREAILAQLATAPTQTAIFTELIALRYFVNAILKRVACGFPMSEADYDAELANTRRLKHRAAADVLDQYSTNPPDGVQR